GGSVVDRPRRAARVARRVRAGAGREPSRPAVPEALARLAPDLARPRHGSTHRRRRIGHVPRPHRRDRTDPRGLVCAAPPVHRGPDRGRAATRRKRDDARCAPRRGARSRAAADGLPLPSALPTPVLAMSRGGAGARGGIHGADGRLLAAARPRSDPTFAPNGAHFVDAGDQRLVGEHVPGRGRDAHPQRRNRMTGSAIRRGGWIGLVLVAALAAAAAAAYAGTSANAAGETLVIDRSFEIKTSDPQRAFEPTASLVNRGIFDTLFTCRGSDVAHPIPLLAQSWKVSKDAKTYTFQLKRNVHFADGTPLTSADVVFSFNRLVNLKGNPSFLLAGVTTKAAGKYGVVVRSKTSNTALPAILANTSLGIVNSQLVKQPGA